MEERILDPEYGSECVIVTSPDGRFEVRTPPAPEPCSYVRMVEIVDNTLIERVYWSADEWAVDDIDVATDVVGAIMGLIRGATTGELSAHVDAIDDTIPPPGEAPKKVVLSKQVQMFMSSLSPEGQAEMSELISKLASGEIQGEPVSPEEVKRLQKEGILPENLDETIESLKKDDKGDKDLN